MKSVPLPKDLIGGLGQSAEVIGRQVDDQLGKRSLQKLKSLATPAASLGKFEAAADRLSDLVPFGHNPKPNEAFVRQAPFVGEAYYAPKVPRHPTASDPFPALLDRLVNRGQVLAMAIHKRDDIKRALERTAVGRVLSDGRNDATITIETTRPTVGQKSSAMTADGVDHMVEGIPPEVLKQFADIQIAQNAFGPFGMYTNAMTGGFTDSLGIGAEGGADADGSLDTNTLRLKRMIDKRSQAMDLYSQSLQSYNTSAKGIIEKMRA